MVSFQLWLHSHLSGSYCQILHHQLGEGTPSDGLVLLCNESPVALSAGGHPVSSS